jgi:hypothetical protein
MTLGVPLKLIRKEARADFPLKYANDSAFEAEITPQDSMIYYNTTDHKMRLRANGAWTNFGGVSNYILAQEKLDILVENTIPSLSNTPVDGSVLLFFDGIQQEINGDYTVSGNSITWNELHSDTTLPFGSFVTVAYLVETATTSTINSPEKKLVFRGDGQFKVADFIDNQIITSDSSYSGIKVYRRKAGDSGSTTIDIKKASTNASILDSTIVLDSVSGDNYVVTQTFSSTVLLPENEIVYMEISSVEDGVDRADIIATLY